MKRTIIYIISALFLFISISTPSFADTDDTFYDKIMEKGEITIGLSADYPPYEFHSTVDGKDEIVGFDINVAQDIADGLGVKLKIEELGFDALIGALKTGKIDAIISGISPTPERLKEVNFTTPYMDVVQTVVVRKADQDKFKSVNDFDGVNVGVQKQTTQEALAKAELIGAKTTSLQKVTDMMPTLLTKKVDAVVLEGPVAQAYVTAYPDDYAFADVKFENGDKQTAIAIPKESPVLEEKINAIITEIKSDGRFKGYQENAAELMFSSDESFISKYGDYFVKGTINTILLAIIGVFFGATLGIVFALMKLSEIAPVRWIANIYIEYVRGTPLLVQIFLVYFGTTVLNIDISAFASGCIALSLNSAAYVAEIIRAGINAVNKGQMEASRSLGMTRTQALQHIIMPQAVKNILPALGNEFVTVIKESSVVSVIGVSELMFQTGNVQGASFQFFAPYAIASLIYFVLTFSISRLLGVAERRMSTSD